MKYRMIFGRGEWLRITGFLIPKQWWLALVVATAAVAAPKPAVRESIEWLDVWLPNTNDHDLPRVLLIGDSITRAYGPQVEANLKGRAYTGRMATSKSLGDPALLDQVALVLKEQHFDIIHFNNGMHGDGYSEQEYAAALPELLATLHQYAPDAKLIWASTTDVRQRNHLELADPKTDRIVARNRAAAEIVEKQHIPIDDLFSLVTGHPEYHAPDGVHFNEQGSQILARQVSNSIGKLLTPAAELPGRGLSQHDFFYAGEQKQQRMFIVRGGRVVWSYIDAAGRGEISDAILRSSGNVLFAHQFGITEITQDRKIVWNYDAPQGTEIHTAQPIGAEHVVFIQNGNPAMLRVIHVPTRKIVREFQLPVGNPASIHGQFRHARLTDAGTIVVAHMDMNKVVEYDATGRELWSYAIDSPWSAARLKNGNTLIATNRKLVREVDPQGRPVWELTPADLRGYPISGFQIAVRLANGNTLVNDWVNSWNTMVDPSNPPVQAFELTPGKRLVWALRSWLPPADLGPATTIQLLGPDGEPDSTRFGDIH